MKMPVMRAFLLVMGLAMIGAGALPSGSGVLLAAPALLVTETSTAEPPTATNTPTNTATSTPTNTPTDVPPSPTATAVAGATNTPVPGPDPSLTPGPDVTATNTPVPGPDPSPTFAPAPEPSATPVGVPTSPPPVDPSASPIATLTSVPPPRTTAQPGEVADPAITKTVDRNVVAVGDQVVFTLTVTNLGNSTAQDVSVTDTLPAFLELESAVASRGSVSISGATVTVTIGSLAPGEVVTITITARVVATAEPPANRNLATVSSSSTTDDPGNNSSSVELTVLPGTPAPPVSLPSTSAPSSNAPWLIGLGMGLIVLSLTLRRRRA